MENSIDCKIGDFQTEGNVIMLHKHLDKSVFVSFFLTHTCNTINKSKLYKKKKHQIFLTVLLGNDIIRIIPTGKL